MDLAPGGDSRRVGLVALAGGALIGLAAGLAWFAAPGRVSSLADPSAVVVPAPVVGAPAPEFELEVLDGERLRLSDLRGRVVVLNFWATWCGPCRVEMPDLEERAARYVGRLTVLGVNFDEPADEVAAFRDQVGVTFPLLLDPGAAVQRLYRVLGYPTTFFVDPEGIIRVQHIGLMTSGQIDGYLEQMGIAP
jgi:cytochrome c biogenesis protein CcmG/thiol:disulfide interchange protein DsbE